MILRTGMKMENTEEIGQGEEMQIQVEVRNGGRKDK